MPGVTTLQTIGRWDKEVGVPLRDALLAWMDVTGKDGERACRRAIVEMAKAAKALTAKARKNRTVQQDEHGKFVDVFNQSDSGVPSKLYDWAFSADNPDKLPGTWLDGKRIGNHGLAQRSWMWGLKALGGRSNSKPISGASRVQTISKETVGGYIKINMLRYILKVLPAGWEAMVKSSAGNRIMGETARRLESRQKRAVERRDRKSARLAGHGIEQFFLKGL